MDEINEITTGDVAVLIVVCCGIAFWVASMFQSPGGKVMKVAFPVVSEEVWGHRHYQMEVLNPDFGFNGEEAPGVLISFFFDIVLPT